VQFHVAHSARVMGAAAFAAGPYQCAGERYPRTLFRALNVCADFGPGPFLGPPDPQRSIRAVDTAAETGGIDDPAGLRGDRVFLFSGRRDTLVPTSVMDTVETFYRAFVGDGPIAYVKDVDAGHAMVTKGWGNACDGAAEPFVNACGYDLAGAALQHIYGALSSPASRGDSPAPFEQAEFLDPARTHGMAAQGYVYVPKACSEGGRCRLHVALHGCLQNAETVGEAFVRHAGYNEWAEANRIVVLYPQTAASGERVGGMRLGTSNPQACWDWWGFTGDDYARRSGAQISAIAAMIDRLAQGCPAGSDRGAR
jgi:hypothetical protein